MLSVHVGLHKTGTTSIQAALGTAKGHIRRRQAYLRWTDLFITDGTINEAGVPRIRGLSDRGWHSVVSSEGGLGAMSLMYPDAAAVARRLDELLGDQDLQVIVYVRPQHEWAASAYTQYVKEGGTQHPRDYATALLAQPHIRYTALVDDLRSNVGRGRLIVRPYSAGMDAVTDFFEVADLGPVPPYLGHLHVNQSLPAEEVGALRQANEAGAPVAVAPVSGAAGGKRSPLPEDSQAQLHEVFVEDWRQLSADLLSLPGHDPAEFLAVVDASRDWAPLPFIEPVPRVEMTTVSSGEARIEPSANAGSTMTERLHRWEFQLRHGPRQTLLKTLMRAG